MLYQPEWRGVDYPAIKTSTGDYSAPFGTVCLSHKVCEMIWPPPGSLRSTVLLGQALFQQFQLHDLAQQCLVQAQPIASQMIHDASSSCHPFQ